jgi:site-specific DNA-cytosine methylase
MHGLVKRSAQIGDAIDPDDGTGGIRQAIAVVLKYGYTSWSLENVSTPPVRAVMDELVNATPHLVAYTTVDAADFGAPTTRRRLIAGPPAMIQHLRETPVIRVSVAEAFKSAGVPLPAQYIKNSTRTRDGNACVRSVQGPAHTQTASHPLTWCKADGTTVRCLSVAETAVIQGFPVHWMLPSGSRAGIRALGNAVVPSLAKAVMLAACEVSGVDTNDGAAKRVHFAL